MLELHAAFVLGVLHALEPGHGKTAMATYMLDGKARWFDSLIVAVSAGLSHTLLIAILAAFAHFGSHYLAGTDVGHPEIFPNVGGFLLMLIGFYLLISNHRQEDSCCSHSQQKVKGLRVSALFGLVLGFFPCPTLLAALTLALNSGRTEMVVVAVALFTSGMVLSMFLCGIVLKRIGQKNFHQLRLPISWRKIQGLLITIIGIIYIF